MNFKELTKEEISDFIVRDPKLAYLALCDEDLVDIHEKGIYNLQPGSYYIGIEDEGNLVCVLKYEYFSNTAILIHPYTPSRLHGTGLPQKIYSFCEDHFLKNTKVRKLMAWQPAPCIHAQKAIRKLGFVKEGRIKKCLHWRQELTDMVLYGKILKEGDK